MNQYEAMFLFDPTFGATYESCETEIRRLMERAKAEILFCRKWDDRRLAFRVKGRKRGVYVLVYFNAPTDRIGPLERDARLSENLLRMLILRADGVTPELMEKAHASRGEEHAGDGVEAEGPPSRFRSPRSRPYTPHGRNDRTPSVAAESTIVE